MATGDIEVVPVGVVERKGASVSIRIYPDFGPGLKGLDGFSHILVCYWFHGNDTPDKRSILQVHPRGNPSNPLTGVFATRSPHRPNLLGISVCEIVSVIDTTVFVSSIDAVDGTPIIDIKPYLPHNDCVIGAVVPDRVNGKG